MTNADYTGISVYEFEKSVLKQPEIVRILSCACFRRKTEPVVLSISRDDGFFFAAQKEAEPRVGEILAK